MLPDSATTVGLPGALWVAGTVGVAGALWVGCVAGVAPVFCEATASQMPPTTIPTARAASPSLAANPIPIDTAASPGEAAAADGGG